MAAAAILNFEIVNIGAEYGQQLQDGFQASCIFSACLDAARVYVATP